MKSICILAAAVAIAVSSTSALAADAEVSFVIDGTKVGAPISKYIYGQFVEHLGRSIYGGLWAEMLEDRKFGREIVDDYQPFDLANDWFGKPSAFTYLKGSPWKVIGPKGTVTMDKKDAYVGDWSPVIKLPGDGTEAGLSQGNETYNGAAGVFGGREREEVCGACRPGGGWGGGAGHGETG